MEMHKRIKDLEHPSRQMARIYRIANGYQLVPRFLLVFHALPSSETQGELVGAGKSLSGWEKNSGQ